MGRPAVKTLVPWALIAAALFLLFTEWGRWIREWLSGRLAERF